MKKISLLFGLIAILTLSSCRSHKKLVTEQTYTDDSTRIEIRERVIIVPDTVYITLPQQECERTTIDSISHLETDFAISEMRIHPNGSVRHTLKTKQTSVPVVTLKKTTNRDTTTSVYKCNTEKKQIDPKMEKSKWLEVIISFVIVAIAICVLLIRRYREI